MKTLFYLIKRNIKVYFNDKGLFFTSLITPVILLVLYSTFLANVFEDSFLTIFKDIPVDKSIITSLVSGQLISSLLAVTSVTVAFSSNMLMANDRITGAINDINVTPVKKSYVSLSYFVATFISTLIVSMCALILCLIYASVRGYTYSLESSLYLILDIVILTLFASSLSSIINYFLKTQGGVSGVGTIVSAGYGFICGAYMPISSFSKALQKIISFLPGTYGTALLKNHTLMPILKSIKFLPNSVLKEIKDGLDCNIYFFDNIVSIKAMYLILIATITICIIIYIFISNKRIRRKEGRKWKIKWY